MEDVFRLCVLRTTTFDETKPHLKLAQDTPFQRSLTAVTGDVDAVEDAKKKSREYAKDNFRFIKSLDQVTLSKELSRFGDFLDKIVNDSLASPEDVDEADQDKNKDENDEEDDEEESDDEDDEDEEHENVPPRPLTAEKEKPVDLPATIIEGVTSIFGVGSIQDILSKLTPMVAPLKDSIIVIKRLPEEHKRPIAALTRFLLDIDFLQLMNQDEKFPHTIDEMIEYRNRPLLMPTALELDAIRRNRKRRAELQAQAIQNRLKGLQRSSLQMINKFKALDTATTEIRALGLKHLNQPDPTAKIPAYDPPKELQPEGLRSRHLELLTNLSNINKKQFEMAANLVKEGTTIDPARVLDSTGALAATKLAERLLDEHKSIQPLYPTPAYEPLKNPVRFDLFQKSAAEALSEQTSNVLRTLNIPLLKQPVQETLASLEEESRKLNTDFQALVGQRQENVRLVRIGDRPVIIRTPNQPLSMVGAGLEGMFEAIEAQLGRMNELLALADQIQPSGDADLLIVKQQLLRYEGGDVAHVENILRGELKKRETTVKDENETISFMESERSDSKENARDTTERFETSRESKSQIDQESSAQASATITGSYGPFVSFSASASGSTKNAQQSAMNTASKYAKDIVDKSTAKITERILERMQRTVRSTISELNYHEINNTFKDNANAKHIAGVYQWVNKVYEARVHNYGERKMYDFMLPEPAAFFIFSRSHRNVAGIDEIKEPPELTHTPDMITSQNAQGLAMYYGVNPTDLPPFPEPLKWIHTSDQNTIPDTYRYLNNIMVKCPEGYKVVAVRIFHMAANYIGLGVFIGQDFINLPYSVSSGLIPRPDNEANKYHILTSHVAGEFPVGITMSSRSQSQPGKGQPFTITFSFLCQVTTAEQTWKYNVWKMFKLANDTAKAAYETKLAELRANAAAATQLFQIQGTNPVSNLTTMRDEIKKGCIALLTNSQFESFSAIDEPAATASADFLDNGDPPVESYPKIDALSAFHDGSIVRFLEQAFEWNNMTFTLYPYFWARKSTWLQRISYDDPDPIFNRFLKAGYARVSLPVRPGFVTAVAHYLDFAEPWGGGELPPIGSDTYISVAQETMEETGAPQKEKKPPSTPWDVVVPTTLVKLRADDELPRWKPVGNKFREMEKRDGKWQVVPEE